MYVHAYARPTTDATSGDKGMPTRRGSVVPLGREGRSQTVHKRGGTSKNGGEKCPFPPRVVLPFPPRGVLPFPPMGGFPVGADQLI